MLGRWGDVAESSPTQAWWVQNHLDRWHKDVKYRKSLSEIGWTEEQIIQYDELALEDHSYIATIEERTRNEKSCVLKLNKEGVQGPMNQRLDFVEAKRKMKRLHGERVKETSEKNTPFILYSDQDNEENNNSKDLKNMIIKSMPKQDGGLILRSHRETCRGIQHVRPDRQTLALSSIVKFQAARVHVAATCAGDVPVGAN